MDIRGEMLIGGLTVPGSTQPLYGFEAAIGARREVGSPGASPADLERACALTAAVILLYRETMPTARAAFPERIAQEILDLGDALVVRGLAENGLPRARLEGERGRMVCQLRMFAEAVCDGEFLNARTDPALPERKSLPRPDRRLPMIPLGPVAVFGASNFPFAFSVAGGDTAFTLAAGCPVVVKAHSTHPDSLETAAAMLTPGIHAAYCGRVAALSAHPRLATVAHGLPGAAYQGWAALFAITGAAFLADPHLAEEVFEAAGLLVRCRGEAELRRVLENLEGRFTAALHIDEADHPAARVLLPILETKAGRILVNDFGTGVEVAHAKVHGGPSPATADDRSTSVGSVAIDRFLRPMCYEDLPATLLPSALGEDNPLGLRRRLDGTLTPPASDRDGAGTGR